MTSVPLPNERLQADGAALHTSPRLSRVTLGRRRSARAMIAPPSEPYAHYPVDIFVSYSPTDEEHRGQLENHLAILQQNGGIRSWHSGLLVPGQNISAVTLAALDRAQIIILLVSADYLADRWSELQLALDRHTAGRACVIPVIVRSCDWTHGPFGLLQPLPRDGRAATSWSNPNEAWAHIAYGIRATVATFAQGQSLPLSPVARAPARPVSIAKTDGDPRTTEADANDRAIGMTLPNGYVIQERIGTGVLSRVYRAEHRLLERTAAVKLLHEHLVTDGNASRRFIIESKVLSRVRHANIVEVFDVGTVGTTLYSVTELVHGRPLSRVAQEEGPLSFRRIVAILSQTLSVLAALHDSGITYKHLHPDSIRVLPMYNKADRIKVMDLSLYAALSSDEPLQGLMAYRAPEQILSHQRDGRTDLYTCGVILFELLTGQLPFTAESPMASVIRMLLAEAPPNPATIAPERQIPRGLADAALKAMRRDPDQRFQTAAAFSGALGQASLLLEHEHE